MIVQHIEISAIERECADEVAEILVPNLVGDDNTPRLNRINRDAKHITVTRMRRAAVGYVHRHRQAVDNFVAICHLAERRRAEYGNESIFGRHLVFRFHADVINLAVYGIGIHDKFRAATA